MKKLFVLFNYLKILKFKIKFRNKVQKYQTTKIEKKRKLNYKH